MPLWFLKDCIKPDEKIATYDIEGVELVLAVAFQEDQPGLFQTPAYLLHEERRF